MCSDRRGKVSESVVQRVPEAARRRRPGSSSRGGTGSFIIRDRAAVVAETGSGGSVNGLVRAKSDAFQVISNDFLLRLDNRRLVRSSVEQRFPIDPRHPFLEPLHHRFDVVVKDFHFDLSADVFPKVFGGSSGLGFGGSSGLGFFGGFFVRGLRSFDNRRRGGVDFHGFKGRSRDKRRSFFDGRKHRRGNGFGRTIAGKEIRKAVHLDRIVDGAERVLVEHNSEVDGRRGDGGVNNLHGERSINKVKRKAKLNEMR